MYEEREHDACGVGFLADLSNRPSHDVVRLGLEAAAAMVHRGARAADGRTGDGAGLMCETPRALLVRELAASHVRVPERHLAAIAFFMPRDAEDAGALRARIEAAARVADLQPLRWRLPAVEPSVLGDQARLTAPSYEQLIVDMGPGNVNERMRVARRTIGRVVREFGSAAVVVSCSPGSIVYKGLLSSNELGAYYADLRDPLFTSRFAVFHQRFSTNTSPSWRLVQPFNYIGHNGEINTIAGNRAWMQARGITLQRGASDSLDFDTAIDTMLGSGYRIDEAVDFMLSPSVDARDERLRAYYDAHVPTIEPWDGPAAIVFANNDVVGAGLDRSGFRPMRWCRTASDKVLCASEAGVVDFGADTIVKRGRLGPGERLVVRFASGELVEPTRYRDERRERADFRSIVRSWAFAMPDADATPLADGLDPTLVRFGYARDEVKDVIGVIASGAGEPMSSMGDDAALPLLETRLPIAAYLRQRFAQVTNPPIDSVREGLVFDMRAWIGSGETNGDVPAPNAIVVADSAIFDEPALRKLTNDPRLVTHTLKLELGEKRLAAALDAIVDAGERAVQDGATLIVLDDRDTTVPIPAILAAGALHKRLTESGLRMQSSIAIADGFARDAHAAAAAIASGANIVVPWLALRASARAGTRNAYLGTVRIGLVKILAKLGICTLRSYVGAQTFETLGLAREVVERSFSGMRAHAPTLDFNDIEADLRAWASAAEQPNATPPERGLFRYRREGVRHAFDPTVIKTLRVAAMHGDGAAFERLSDAMEAREPATLRDLIEPMPIGGPVPLEEVEPVSEIVRRFVGAAMSLGAIAPEVHATIAEAANRLGARSNSGEGGEHVERYPRSSPARSAIKQIASARFGVGATYLASADEIEIKMAQGSKPGEGGQIPGFKVSEEIAALRGAVAGQTLISPPPHHDIYSIEDLAELIYDLRRAAPQAKIAVKLVSQAGIGHVASGVAKARADAIHVSGHDGGTGASPLASIKSAGLPWELGLVETHHALVTNGLRARVQLRVDGGFKTGRDVLLAAMLGADAFGFGSALLVALGCIYARQCHKNTCPVGIATQDPALRAKYAGTVEEAMAYFTFIANDVRRRLAAMGARSLAEVHGRSDLLRQKSTLSDVHRRVDLSEILRLPETSTMPDAPAVLEAHIDDFPGMAARPIRPGDRAVGARLAHTVVMQRANGEPVSVIQRRYVGSAGQSFGAFITDGIELELAGEANDYVGKSMEGGRIVVRGAGGHDEPAIGNASFYGARGGEGFIVGTAGERLAVRNSGATVVIDGAGDHACEYMTRGTVVILGPTGRNLASGMSGGTLYALGTTEEIRKRMGPTDCSIRALDVDSAEALVLASLLGRYVEATDSDRARTLLAEGPAALSAFSVVAPKAPAPVMPEVAKAG